MPPTATEGSVSLSPEQAAKLTESLQTATQRLDETRVKMDERQKEIGTLLTRVEQIEKKNTDGGSELEAFKKRLTELGTTVQALAEQNTNLVELTRKQTLRLASADAAPDHAFMYRGPSSRGAVFASRQQAVELGYFFMATMRPENAARAHACRWLKENGAALRHLPNFPRSFIEYLGAQHQQVIERCYKQGTDYAVQDLAGGVTPGSVLTFPEFANTFIRNVEMHGVFRRNALVWPMGAETVFIPRRTAGVSYYWVGEAQGGSKTEPAFDMLRMIAKKGMMLHQYSSELAQDENAAIALADLIMYEFALAQAAEEDRIGFTGNGAGGSYPGFAGFYGVLGLDSQAYTSEAAEDKNKTLQYVAGTGLDRTDEVTLKSLRTMIGLCHTWARQGAKWFAHRTVLQDLFGIETAGGGPIASPAADGMERLVGYGVEAVEAMPISPGTPSTRVFTFGNLRKSWILGDRRQAEVETSEHYAFNTDQLTIRFTARTATLPHSPTGMVVYVTAS